MHRYDYPTLNTLVELLYLGAINQLQQCRHNVDFLSLSFSHFKTILFSDIKPSFLFEIKRTPEFYLLCFINWDTIYLSIKVKTCRRWLAAHLHRRETFETFYILCHWGDFFQGSYSLKFERWYRFYIADKDTVPYSLCSARENCV